MAKVTWGGADLESALDEWEDDGGYPQYAGDRPPKGVYRWDIRVEKTTSKNGFNQLVVHLVLNPHKPDHQKYKGYHCMSYIIVKEDGSTAFRVRPFLDAIGVTARQFRTGTISKPTDRTTSNGQPIEDITKIGPVVMDGLKVMAAIKPQRDKPEYEDVSFLPMPDDADDDTASPDPESDVDDNEPPF